MATLTTATTVALGGVKIGSGVNAAGDGTISIAPSTVETYDTGTGATWTKPAAANWVKIEIWGGGGSGGNGATNAAGGGGGGGAYNSITARFADLGGAVTYTVGGGGAAQAGNAAGNAGGQTSVSLASFAGDGTKTLNAYGGEIGRAHV